MNASNSRNTNITGRLKLLEQKIIDRRKNIECLKYESSNKLKDLFAVSSNNPFINKFYSRPNSRESFTKSYNSNFFDKRIMINTSQSPNNKLSNSYNMSSTTKKFGESKLVDIMSKEIDSLKNTIKDSYLRHLGEVKEKEALISTLTEKVSLLESVYFQKTLEYNEKIEELGQKYKAELEDLKIQFNLNQKDIKKLISEKASKGVQTYIDDYEKKNIITLNEDHHQVQKTMESPDSKDNILKLNNKSLSHSDHLIRIGDSYRKDKHRSIHEISSNSKGKSIIYKEKIVKVLYIYCPKELLIHKILDSLENSFHFLLMPDHIMKNEYESKMNFFAKRIQVEQIKNPKNTMVMINEPSNKVEALEWVSKTSKIDRIENIISIKCENDLSSLASEKEDFFSVFDANIEIQQFEENQIEEIQSYLSSFFIHKEKSKSKKVIFFLGDDCKEVFSSVICSEMPDFEQSAYPLILQEIKESAIIIDFPTFFLQKVKSSYKQCKILIDYPASIKDLNQFNHLKIQLNNINHECYVVHFDQDDPKVDSPLDIPGLVKIRRNETIREVWKKFRRLGIIE